MNRLMNRSLVASAALAAMLGSAHVVQAASETCSTGLPGSYCTTDWVRANASTHHVHVSVSSWQTWSVLDIDTGVQVGHGTNGIWGTERTITGLFGRYTARISNIATSVLIGGRITIRND